MKIFQAIKELLSKLVSSKQEVVNKYFMSQEIEINKKGLEGVLNTFAMIEKSPTLRIAAIGYLKQDKDYQNYLKALHGKVAHDEFKMPLSGLKSLCILTIKELEGLAKYLAAHPEIEKSTEVGNLTFSQVALLGIIEVGVNVERFTTAFLCKVLTLTGGFENGKFNYEKANKMFGLTYPWYNKEIKDNFEYITGLVVRHCNYKTEDIGLKELILGIFKTQNFDPVLINEGKPNSDFIPMITDNVQVSECALFGLRGLNPFRWFGQRSILKEHERILRQEYEVAWMKNQVTLLEYQLSGLNPEDPKIKEQQKIIDYYAELIAKISSEIDKYRKG